MMGLASPKAVDAELLILGSTRMLQICGWELNFCGILRSVFSCSIINYLIVSMRSDQMISQNRAIAPNELI